MRGRQEGQREGGSEDSWLLPVWLGDGPHTTRAVPTEAAQGLPRSCPRASREAAPILAQ